MSIGKKSWLMLIHIYGGFFGSVQPDYDFSKIWFLLPDKFPSRA